MPKPLGPRPLRVAAGKRDVFLVVPWYFLWLRLLVLKNYLLLVKRVSLFDVFLPSMNVAARFDCGELTKSRKIVPIVFLYFDVKLFVEYTQ